MPHGPTQNYDDATLTAWRARPGLALAVRAGAVVVPLVLALALGLAAAVWLPPSRVGLPAGVWVLAVVVLAGAVPVVCARWLRRVAPLSALLRLSLVLPDGVPGRFTVAQRRWSPEVLTGEGGTGARHRDVGSGERLLALVGSLAAHDTRTRQHGERVQAYAALIGRELGLSDADVDRLSWAALLHDVGKVHVAPEIINKAGRPTDEEWAQLQAHPHHGGELVEPLRDWLGPWLDGVEQHHERWDGRGYPRALAGEEISLAARIIAVADTYDVITSARSYKKPMSAEQARAEITRCAGQQFDPAVVRALLSVGIGKLRWVAGPSTLLALLPVAVAAPAQAASAVSGVSAGLVGTAGAAGAAVAGPVLASVLAATVGLGGVVVADQEVDLPAAAVALARGGPVSAVAALEVADVTGGGVRPDDDGEPDPPAAGALSGAGGDGSAVAAAPGSTAAEDGSGPLVTGGGAGEHAAVPEAVETGAAPTALPTSGSAEPGAGGPGSAATPAPVTVTTPPTSLRLPLPSVTVPPLPSLPGVTLPGVTLPPVTVPPVSVPSVPGLPRTTVPPVVVTPTVPPLPLPLLSSSRPSASSTAPSSAPGGSPSSSSAPSSATPSSSPSTSSRFPSLSGLLGR